ncbi:MAG: lipocalin family protein [Rhodobacteraceae bacterium]|nr:lipocalin family protein [Paracoccaceae bacterium]
MHRLRAALCLALAACAPAAPAGFRDADRTIASAALFDPARFADVWHVVAAFGEDAGCGPLAQTWAPAGPGRFNVTGTACGPAGSRAFAATAEVTGPGRLAFAGPRGREELWVLWTDDTYRVAAIGTPDGRRGWILARRPDIAPDLYEAAREVMDFNGYDMDRLVRL